jgi:type I restriction enzyme S subunit
MNARINHYVNIKKKLITLLNEQKQSIISHAVTRGLDPNVRLKASGIEWLGDIPEHWEIRRLRYVGEVILGLTYKPSDIVDKNEGILVLRSSNVQNGQISLLDNVYVKTEVPKKIITRKGDILICSRNGSRALIGKNAKISQEVVGETFGAFMTIFRSEFSDYLHYVFNSQLFEYQSGSFLTSTINQLTVDNLKIFKIPLPSSEEQIAIVSYLDDNSNRLDGLIDKANDAVILLSEYRTSMISDIVTGKIDVRELGDKLPDQIDENNNNNEIALSSDFALMEEVNISASETDEE